MSTTLKLASNSSKAPNFEFSIDNNVVIRNKENFSLYYYAAAIPAASIPEQLNEIPAYEELVLTAVDLGAPSNKYIIIVNKETANAAEVEIILQ